MKTYYRDGRVGVFGTVNLTDASMYRGNIITNWPLDLSCSMFEGDIPLLTMRWYSVLE